MNRLVNTITVGRVRRSVPVKQRPITGDPQAPGRTTLFLHKPDEPRPPRRRPARTTSTVADDVSRILRDRTDFPKHLWGKLL